MQLCSMIPDCVAFLLLFSMGLSCGCSNQDAWKAQTQPMRGKVVLNGGPAVGVIVTFHSTGGDIDVRKSDPFGVVGADGTYEVRTYRKGDGLPPGEYAVTLVMRKDPGVQDFTDLLAGAFDDVTESKWTFKVEPGQTELPPIELSGVKVVNADRQRSRSSAGSPLNVPE